MAEDEVKAADAGEEVKAKKRSFRKFSYRGVELTQLLDLKVDELQELLHSRARRRFVPPLVPRLSFTGAGGGWGRGRGVLPCVFSGISNADVDNFLLVSVT